MRDFSETIKELRTTKRLTQSQLADRLGVKKSIISAYETDSRPPSLDMLIKYAQEFHVSIDFLLGMKNKKVIKVDSLTDAQIDILNTLVNEFQSKNK